MNHEQLYDRILGCLVTAGMGDAIGAPSEAMSRAEILEKFGGPIDTFLDGGENAYAYGNLVGEVTDDASQMYEMAKAVIACGGKLTVEAAAQALVTWSESYPKYYPRNAGPTTSYVINELKAGKDPIATGLVGHVYGRGTSNGAAMRVAAAGLCRPGDLDYAVRTAVTMTAPSHGTQHAYAGACCIAAGIAAAIGGAGLYGVLKACFYGAEEGERIGRAEACSPSCSRPSSAPSPPARWRRPGRRLRPSSATTAPSSPAWPLPWASSPRRRATLPGPFWGAPISAAIPTPSPASRECWPGPTPAFPLCPRAGTPPSGAPTPPWTLSPQRSV